MSYIGAKPTIGNFQICDAISVVNGQAAYTMQVGSTNVIPQSANHMIVSLNGVIQKPNSSYTVSGATITFASNLATGDVINFIQILGDVLDLGVPSDATVTTAKVADGAITSAKLSAGKVLQVISTTKTDTFSESISARGTGSAITGLTATITPTSASSKLLVYATLNTSRTGGYGYANFIIHRDGSSVLVGDSAGSRLPVTVGDNIGVTNAVAMFNTFSFGQVTAGSTNATTFDIRLENAGSSSSKTFYVNRSVTDTDSNGFTRAISSIMVMEVAT